MDNPPFYSCGSGSLGRLKNLPMQCSNGGARRGMQNTGSSSHTALTCFLSVGQEIEMCFFWKKN